MRGLTGNKGKLGPAELDVRSARVTLTQTRAGGLLDHSKGRNHEFEWAHRQTPGRANGNGQ